MVKCINNILNSFNELTDLINNSSDYKKYKMLEKTIREDNEIMGLIDEIKSCQKQIIKFNSIGKDVSDLDKIISSDLEKLDNIPIYVEYSYLQSDLNEMFQIIKNTIEKCLNDITN